MVVSNNEIASRVGADVMRRGGNAIDAAVAVGFALTVTYPVAGNIGGGGFMVIRLANGQSVALDYREVAPRAASRNMYLDSAGKLTDKKHRRSPLGRRSGRGGGNGGGVAQVRHDVAGRGDRARHSTR